MVGSSRGSGRRRAARRRLQLRIRRAAPTDVDAIAKNVQSVADEGRYLFVEEVTEEARRSMGRLIRDPDCLVLVAEVGAGRARRVVGSLTLGRYGSVRKTRHVRALGMLVVKGYRGMGLGTELISRALEWARGRADVEKVTLGVFSNNRRAYGLYRKFGFEIEGVKRRHYLIAGRYSDEIDMALFVK